MTRDDFFARYEFDVSKDRVGGGAFGTVYRAYDNVRDEWKAIKLAEVKIIDDKEFSLISEFQATSDLLDHKNIANYEAVHQFKMPNGIFDYAIMQYYPTGNLKELLKSRNLSTQQKKHLAQGLIDGIQYLHHHKTIHRDLKPSNILISEYHKLFTPKIADFGLSKLIDSSDASKITNSFGGGTLAYSAPEQLLGNKLKVNADYWSLGVILYELFTDTKPFDTDDKTGSAEARRRLIYHNIINRPVPDRFDLIPAPYDSIVRDCLIKDPDRRNVHFNTETINTSIDNFEDEKTVLITPKKKARLPKISFPKFVIPKISSPSFNLPKISTPSLTVPRINWNRILAPFRNAVIAISGYVFTSKEWLRKNKKIILLLLFMLISSAGLISAYKFAVKGPNVVHDDNLFRIESNEGVVLHSAKYDKVSPFWFGKATAETNDSIFIIGTKGDILEMKSKRIIQAQKDNIPIALNENIEDETSFVNDETEGHNEYVENNAKKIIQVEPKQIHIENSNNYPTVITKSADEKAIITDKDKEIQLKIIPPKPEFVEDESIRKDYQNLVDETLIKSSSIDSDGDGIVNKDDSCVSRFGDKENGCPSIDFGFIHDIFYDNEIKIGVDSKLKMEDDILWESSLQIIETKFDSVSLKCNSVGKNSILVRIKNNKEKLNLSQEKYFFVKIKNSQLEELFSPFIDVGNYSGVVNNSNYLNPSYLENLKQNKKFIQAMTMSENTQFTKNNVSYTLSKLLRQLQNPKLSLDTKINNFTIKDIKYDYDSGLIKSVNYTF